MNIKFFINNLLIILLTIFVFNNAFALAPQISKKIHDIELFPLSLILFLFESDEAISKKYKSINRKFLTHVGQRNFQSLSDLFDYYNKKGSSKIKEFYNKIFLPWLAENNSIIFNKLKPLKNDKYKIINTKIPLITILERLSKNLKTNLLHNYNRKIKDKNKNAWEDLLSLLQNTNNQEVRIDHLLKVNSYLYMTKAMINGQTAGIVTYDLLKQLQFWIIQNISFIHSWLPGSENFSFYQSSKYNQSS